jgi:hypothetical protein
MCKHGKYDCGGCPDDEPEITVDNWEELGANYPCNEGCEKEEEPCEKFEPSEEDEDDTGCWNCGHRKECHEVATNEM